MKKTQSKTSPAQSRQEDALIEAVEAAIAREAAARQHVMAGQIERSEMFEFCRVLRAWFPDWDEQEAAQAVEKVLRMRNPSSFDPWSAEFPDYDDPLASVLANWNEVKFPVGSFERAVAMSKLHPVRPPGITSEIYCTFLSICSALQCLARENPIIVSVKTFAAELQVSEMTISNYRKLATRHGYLVRAEPAVPHRLATKFWFHLL